MGTRHCIIAIKDKQPKIAQYGQFDGYPGGAGSDVLSFLQESDLQKFGHNLDNLSFLSDKEAEELQEAAYKMSDDEFEENYPEFCRNTSADVLGLVYIGKVKRLVNSFEFTQDSLFCEWCYVIDLDKQTFEVYKGFNEKPLSQRDRFFLEGQTYKKYHPVKLVKKYKLNKLPDHKKFFKDLSNK